VIEQSKGIPMVADSLTIVPKTPVVDLEKGIVTGWRAGKVAPGDKTGGRFIWRGPVHLAPLSAQCEKPEDQVLVDAARAKHRESKELERLSKQAAGAALAAQAAAQAIGRLPQLPPIVTEAPEKPAKGAGRLRGEVDTSKTGARDPAVVS
jgi:hypothetical protein